MKTPTQAMLWELARLSGWETLLRVIAMCFFTILMSLVSRNLSDIQGQFISGIAVGMFLITAPFSQAWLGELDSKSTGFSFRLGYVRPVSTLRLVIIPMFFSVVVAMACYLIPALFASLLLRTSFPMLGPALLIALVVQLFIAVVWSFTSRFAKIFGVVLLAAVIVGLSSYLVMQMDVADPLLMALSNPNYFDMNWRQQACLLGTMLATTIATVVAVDRQRHGDAWGFSSKAIWRLPTNNEQPVSNEPNKLVWYPFRNRLAAQCWYEWRQSGMRVLITGFMLAIFAVALLLIGNWLYPDRNANTVVWAIAIVFSPLLLQVVGIEGAVGLKHVHGTTRISLFDATRGFTNDQIILIKLLTIAFSVTVGWLAMLIVAWIDLSWFGRADDWQANHIVSRLFAETLPKISSQLGAGGWVVAFLNLISFFVSSSSALLAFSLWLPIYPRRFAAGVIVGALHLLIAVFAFVRKLPMEFALNCYGYGLAILITCVLIVSIWRSIKLKSMRADCLAAAIGLWATCIVPTIYWYGKIAPELPFAIPTAGVVFGAAALLVPLASTILAPLAYATHRNG